jgi:2-C-methyl-D-erythritol 4-phosphate cytidylyltransferase/2-C-methyl-D-erythritol 2,4-cyclodiphosphate synthase
MIAALIAAAGTGSRTGLKENKIFFTLPEGETVIEKTVKAFKSSTRVDHIVIICSQNDKPRLVGIFGDTVEYVIGGNTRGSSVMNGLKAIKDRYRIVLVHDGARPYVTEEIINRVIDNVKEGQGAIAGIRVTDTVKEVNEKGIICNTPERDRLWAAQTPQGFFTNELLFAYEKAGTLLTDDGAVFENAGFLVKMVEGGYFNKKITTREDVELEKVYLSGIGYDVHQFVGDRPLVLGGVNVPSEMGLKGHSDADVLVHAVMDALLGAAGMGDIGKHFPDTDPKYKGISSMLLFKHVVELLKNNGFEIVNISAVVMAQAPKLSAHIQKMNENIASVAGIDVSRVNVAATTTEKLGFVGRLEGIASQATAMLRK